MVLRIVVLLPLLTGIAFSSAPLYHDAIPSPYSQLPSYTLQPLYSSHDHYEQIIPSCAKNTTNPWCLEDPDYPEYEIKLAIQYHYYIFTSLFADVGDLDTRLSVQRPLNLQDETYLCSSETSYVRPLRAKNTYGKWRVIVNNIKANYESYTQTTRVEECLEAGEPCPYVPMCHESKCLQKNIYHRFLVYDSYDHYFPFSIETFKMPSSCACLLGAYFL